MAIRPPEDNRKACSYRGVSPDHHLICLSAFKHLTVPKLPLSGSFRDDKGQKAEVKIMHPWNIIERDLNT